MDVKWFFVIIGIFLTFTILMGMYFIGTFIALQSETNADKQIQQINTNFLKTTNQSEAQFQSQINKSDTNFNRSLFIHDSLYNNITDLKKGLDPVIATITNATEMREQQLLHYNQTSADFDKIENILKIKLQDHVTLNYINQSLAIIASHILNNSEGSVVNGSCSDNGGGGDIVPIENITGKDDLLFNKLHQQC